MGSCVSRPAAVHGELVVAVSGNSGLRGAQPGPRPRGYRPAVRPAAAHAGFVPWPSPTLRACFPHEPQATLAPEHIKRGPCSDCSASIRSSYDRPESLMSDGGGGAPDEAPVMLCDTRMFEVERTRESAVKELGVVDTPTDDPRFNAITK